MLLLAPAARSDTQEVTWTATTPADQTAFTISVGAQLSLTLSASTALPSAVVHIGALQLPQRATFSSSDGSQARATFTWRPTSAGEYTAQFTASTSAGNGTLAAPTLTYTIHVQPAAAKRAKPAVVYPRSYVLTDEKVAHWAVVLKRAVARSQPKSAARAVTTLDTRTTDDTQNIVLVLSRVDVKAGQTWYRVRLPILPNNSTGWVRAGFLGTLYTVHTHLYVDTTRLRATLKRNGVTVFKTIVGVGKSYWPTPRGEFYIRDELTGFSDPAYGPIAFGTSARSAVLTDWPGGGFVGVHGTDEPGILPGHVSHGCIRMPNASILKLARMMPVGTPLTIS